mgnify:CR=1 FL=1
MVGGGWGSEVVLLAEVMVFLRKVGFERRPRFFVVGFGTPKFAGVGVEAGREDVVVRGLNNLFGDEGDVAISSKLDSIINSLKVCIDGVGWVVGVIHALLVEV